MVLSWLFVQQYNCGILDMYHGSIMVFLKVSDKYMHITTMVHFNAPQYYHLKSLLYHGKAKLLFVREYRVCGVLLDTI